MGFKFLCTDAAAAFTAGKLVYPDAIMSSGSILLVDPAHSQGGFSGIPAHAATLPNIARDVAAAVMATTAANTDPIWKAPTVGTGFVAERSGKGGLHVMTSRTNLTGGLSSYRNIALPTAARTYMIANYLHSFYISLWRRTTRVATAGQNPYVALGQAPGTNKGFFYKTQYPGGAPLTPTTGYSLQGGTDNTVGNFLEQMASAWNSTPPTDMDDSVYAWGTYGANRTGAFGNSAGANASRSEIIYRVYLEDLTVSGRTYAQVKAIDDALWAAAFASGGKFYGDTYSDPAVAAP